MLRLALVLSALALTCGGFYVGEGGARNKLVYTGDFITATNIVGKYYGGRVEKWLVDCSVSEGGHGSFVWFAHESKPRYGYSNTPGGWMQFMGSTFYDNVKWTLADAAQRGLKIHPKARSYYEPLGQAVVAGAMYYHHGNPGTWTGGYC